MAQKIIQTLRSNGDETVSLQSKFKRITEEYNQLIEEYEKAKAANKDKKVEKTEGKIISKDLCIYMLFTLPKSILSICYLSSSSKFYSINNFNFIELFEKDVIVKDNEQVHCCVQQ